MQTQVTQKKVLKQKTTPGASAGSGEEAPPSPGARPSAPQLVVEKPESFTWAAILAVVAVICFVALLIFQWIEFQDLSTAFPMKQAVSTAQ